MPTSFSLVCQARRVAHTQGELFRGLLLVEVERDRQPAPEPGPSVVLVEIAGCVSRRGVE
jgi:hypothetical protein